MRCMYKACIDADEKESQSWEKEVDKSSHPQLRSYLQLAMTHRWKLPFPTGSCRVYKPHSRAGSIPNRRWSSQHELQSIFGEFMVSYLFYFGILFHYFYFTGLFLGFWFWLCVSLYACISCTLSYFFFCFFLSLGFSFCYIFVSPFDLPVCLRERERDGEDLGGDEGAEAIINM